ncbi:bifunctional acetate--CoA ligase family protein/GNAT family N-acetyltransferase [Larsenimonas rhizosphaerae]|uniref:bifunctional acetate--CoA ligase family protein/GNAT family N-acetyltransferase n=1 Tax=Larsenimonas rhizosphaerae TaxID=2944682 RepID=UPI0020335E96|nr:GNAT family N-acetyltransferase [Larsenimonas rhizosphaerae]MCM2130645.1 GNAT family N-acetyltransferase [Larsenimonas rhizosphaerae]
MTSVHRPGSWSSSVAVPDEVMMLDKGMGVQFVEHFFRPRAIMVVAPGREDALTQAVLFNLREGGFRGKIWAVAPDSQAGDVLEGVQWVNLLEAVTPLAELVIFCLPVDDVPDQLELLAARGVSAAIILTGGARWSESRLDDPASTRSRLHDIVRRKGVRVMGPECMGVVSTRHYLNASCASVPVARGRLAYLGQSGMVGHALMDWAAARGIGFSNLVALGDSVDVTLADVLDHFNQTGGYRALVLHIEQITNAMHFMTTLREAARHHVVVAIKSGRCASTDLSGRPLAPGLSRRDQVFDAALSRAGVLRVAHSDGLMDALDTLTRLPALAGERVVLVSNGLGLALLAMDELARQGGVLAELSSACRQALSDEGLDVSVSGHNPVDVGSLATPERFERAVRLVADDPGVDVVLTIHVPTRMAPSREVAERLLALRPDMRSAWMSCWMGLQDAREARQLCQRAGVAHYRSPEKAIDGLMLMARYRQVQHLLRQTPPAVQLPGTPARRDQARHLIQQAFDRRRSALTHEECGQVLEGYGMAITPAHYDYLNAETISLPPFSPPWRLRLIHPANCQPFNDDVIDAGGNTSIATPSALADEGARQRAWCQDRNLIPFSACIQPRRDDVPAMSISCGITRDATFGPVVFFGRAGHHLDETADRQVALPPLNNALAAALIEQSSVWSILAHQSEAPDNLQDQLSRLLVTLSHMATDLPHLAVLDINPLEVTTAGELRADSYRLSIGPPTPFAIMPYPEEWQRNVTLGKGQQARLRPVREEDAALVTEFHTRLSRESIRFRYFRDKPQLSQVDLSRLTQLDYDRQMAFLLVNDADTDMLGVARVWNDPDNVRTEFAIIVRDDMHGQGAGRLLMEQLIRYSRHVGTLEMYGKIAPENRAMRALVISVGFTTSLDMDEGVINARLMLNEPSTAWQRQRLGK